MGLDAYFFRHTKVKESDKINQTALSDLIKSNSKLSELFDRLSAIATHKGVHLEDALREAFKLYLDNNGEGHLDEILYFRKFHFLNYYFNYNDDWYAKDKIVTKEQCIELRDRAKACLDECEKIYSNSDCCVVNYLGKSSLDSTRNYEQSFDDTSEVGNSINEICNKYFPCKWNNSTYDKVGHLYNGMCSIIDETDWENEDIIYNADW